MTVKYWLLAEKRPWQLWLADLRGERGSVVYAMRGERGSVVYAPQN